MLRTRPILPRYGCCVARAGASLVFRRQLNDVSKPYTVPKLGHDFSQGIPNLMSTFGFSFAWDQYMEFVLQRLGRLTQKTELEGKDPKTILLLTAREPTKAAIFNYASMAHNHHFFFSGITPTRTEIPRSLRQRLEASFSSMMSLRETFVTTADAMFGPGFVWLVKADPDEYRLLTTYIAGSPYPGAHWRAQSADMNTVGSSGSARPYYDNVSFGSNRQLPPGGINVEPLLCLSTWQHNWMLDWGFGTHDKGGKLAFAEAWWDAIDWEQVAARDGIYRRNLKTAPVAASAASG